MSSELDQLRERFAETAGQLTQSAGAGRALGQIFAHIYFSPRPQSLTDLTEVLGISKGSASMCVRQLEQWGALRRIWIKGERRDYYEATEDFGRIIRRALLDMIGRRMEVTDAFLEESEKLVNQKVARKNDRDDEQWRFAQQRIKKLRTFRDRAQFIWNNSILRLLLK